MLDNIDEAVFLLDRELRICFVNERCCQQLGYSFEELLETDFSAIDSSFGRGEHNDPSRKPFPGSNSTRILSRHKTRDGRSRDVEIRVKPLLDGEQDFLLLLANYREINLDLKDFPVSVIEVLRTLYERSPDAISVKDHLGRWLSVNPRGMDLFFGGGVDYAGKTSSELAASIDESYRFVFEQGAEFDEDAWRSGEPTSRLIDISAPDGTQRTLDETRLPLNGPEGKFDGVLVTIGRDVTAQLQHNDLRAQSNECLYEILKSANGWGWEVDSIGRYTFVSDRVSDILGYTPEELHGKTPFDLMDAEEARRVSELFEGLLENKTEIVDLENWNISKDGTRVCLLTNGIPVFDDNGNVRAYRGYDFDITHLKQRELELQHSKQSLEIAQSITHIGSWEWDVSSSVISWSDETFRIFGHEPSSFVPSYMAFIDAVHADDRLKVESAISNCVENGAPYYVMHRIVRPGGEVRIVIERGNVFHDDEGTMISMTGTVQDVTEQQQAQEALGTRLRYEKGLAACSAVLLANKDDAMEKGLQFLLEASDTDRAYILRNYSDHSAGLRAYYEHEVCAEGIEPIACIGTTEKQFAYHNDEIYDALVSGIAYSVDAEDARPNFRAQLEARSTQSILLIPIFNGNEWMGIVGFDQTRQKRRWLGDDIRLLRTAADMLGSYCTRRHAEEILKFGAATLESEVEESKADIAKLGRSLQLGISRLKQTELDLRESEERFRQMAENSSEVFWIVSLDLRKIIYVNPVFEKMWGFSAHSINGSLLLLLRNVVPEDRSKLASTFRGDPGPGDRSAEFRIKRSDGCIRWIRDRSFPIRDDDGNIIRLAGIMEDITEAKRFELVRQEQARKQRDSLVREVHHRIKNHLQGITGLLQTRMLENPGFLQPLQSTVGQIKAIAVIHGLQGQQDSGHIRLYALLSAIVESLQMLHQAGITLDEKVAGAEGPVISEEEAVPVSLILNELIHNAYKHAVVNGDSNVVTVQLRQSDGDVEVIIINAIDDETRCRINMEAGRGNGLSLIESMMPVDGASLAFDCSAGKTTVVLRLSPPVIALWDSAGLSTRR